MKTVILFVALLGMACSCKPAVTHSKRAIFTSVEQLIRSDTTRTGFFTNASLFASTYKDIEYKTTNGSVFVSNDGSQNILACRYDPHTLQPIWIAVGGGAGGDAGVNYYTVPPENAVYVLGYFEGTARFPITAGQSAYKTIESYGMADMFLAKYRYDTGALEWVTSGGSPYADIIFTDQAGTRHNETIMTVDSVAVTVYANFFGPSRFGDKSVDAKLSGSALMIRYGKQTGIVLDARFATELPE